ncbi:MAG: hypothetical protein US89_C0006G0014 [Candidatus Peregrinibacteria bacterium GW2011_GWF2_38_29]|nr:MAG: hypothetical protein US89_C0006G0014 [Candidatus Peregrinibacteria bacterium GW2011_GWF2_38_29]HBB03204.1 hypothetical protein [Candidatus Peregrinibacteria bacterium]
MNVFTFHGFALYQLITTIFCLVMILKMISRYRRHERTLKELIVWVVTWGVIGGLAFFPFIIDYIAQVFGVKSGTSGFFAIWLIILTYAFFRTFVVVEHIDKKITDLTRKAALDSYDIDRVLKKDK